MKYVSKAFTVMARALKSLHMRIHDISSQHNARHPKPAADAANKDESISPGLGGQYQDLPPGYYTSFYFLGTFTGVILMAWSLFIPFLLPANTISIINASIGPSSTPTLILTTQTVTSGCLLVPVGRLSDILGRRNFLLAGQTLALLGSIVCAVAESMEVLMGAGVLLGVGGAVQLTFTFVVMELVPNKRRAEANGVIFAALLPFSALGGIVARVLASRTKAGWRWFYYLNIIVCGLSILLFLLSYFPPSYKQLNKNTSKREQFGKIDYLGLLLLISGGVLFMLGIAWGGSKYSWTSRTVLSSIFIGAACLVAFVVYESYAKLEQPLLPMHLVKNRNYDVLTITGCIGIMIYFPMSIIWPQQVANLYATDEITIGWLICTFGIGQTFGEAIAGLVFHRIGHTELQLQISCVCMTAFLGGLAAADQHHKAMAATFTLLGGMSVGYLELITIVMVGLVCEEGSIGLASCFLASCRQLTGTIATSIYITILNNRLRAIVSQVVYPIALAAGLPSTSLSSLKTAIVASNPQAIASVPGMNASIKTQMEAAVTTAYSRSYKTVYLTTIAFGGISILAALCVKDVGGLLTDRVARTLRKGPENGFEKADGEIKGEKAADEDLGKSS